MTAINESRQVCPAYPVDYIKQYYLPTMYGIIFIVGLIGNITAIVIYVVKIRPLTSSCIIMLNLAMADLLYILSLPFLVHFYITEDWVLGEFMCRLVRFCFHFNLYGSILLLTCLSAFRYVAVVHPLRAAQVKTQSWGIVSCLVMWLLCLIGIVPMFSLIGTELQNYTDSKTVCIDFASNKICQVWLYNWILSAFGFLVPLFVVCLSYTCVARALSKGPLPHRRAQVHARRLTVLILLVFVVCFTPYHFLRFARIHTRSTNSSTPPSCPLALEAGVHAAYTISRPLAGLNTFFNLALYTMAGERFQQAFWSLFHWKTSLPRNISLSLEAATIFRPRGQSFNDLLQS
ncbi:2-oxoglutarate receptor 1-like [Clupea harengus]|uniref:2-oxoglutarate receptor 1-like n=1 Tax=Clupea harengus TaxID=7950 RepID=A0A6P3VT20_CLUHA|nr:2-oxoglutarate receptor 1-like [Clupea harengus]